MESLSCPIGIVMAWAVPLKADGAMSSAWNEIAGPISRAALGASSFCNESRAAFSRRNAAHVSLSD
ncbi:hypothetical protein WT08_05405 [Burkholderia sp. MSMB1552]|nr:hypothetical protein WT08_05405 [Burkholderia sp. MSMB1552]KWZ51272.1 hypothetical protein WS92_28715 [Burkholderia sp. MSMB1588]